MKKTRWKRSWHFLKIDLKKTNTIQLLFFFFILLSAGVSVAGQEDISVRALRIGGTAHFDVSVGNYPRKEIVHSISRGYRSIVSFTIQIYRINKGFFSFFGDRIVAEETFTRTAGWDQFEEIYFVFSDRNGRMKYYNRDTFFDNLFFLSGVTMEVPGSSDRDLYATVQVTVEPMQLIPPLTIINLFNKRNFIQSKRTRVEL